MTVLEMDNKQLEVHIEVFKSLLDINDRAASTIKDKAAQLEFLSCHENRRTRWQAEIDAATEELYNRKPQTS